MTATHGNKCTRGHYIELGHLACVCQAVSSCLAFASLKHRLQTLCYAGFIKACHFVAVVDMFRGHLQICAGGLHQGCTDRMYRRLGVAEVLRTAERNQQRSADHLRAHQKCISCPPRTTDTAVVRPLQTSRTLEDLSHLCLLT